MVLVVVEAQHVVHHIGSAPERGERHPAPDRLADARQVGRHSQVAGCSGQSEAKGRDDLVEDEQCADRRGRLADGRGELRLGQDGASSRERHRLHEHRRELIAMGADELGRPLWVVERQDDDIASKGRRDAPGVDDWFGSPRRAECRAGHRREQEVVVRAVVVAFELRVLRTTRERTCRSAAPTDSPLSPCWRSASAPGTTCVTAAGRRTHARARWVPAPSRSAPSGGRHSPSHAGRSGRAAPSRRPSAGRRTRWSRGPRPVHPSPRSRNTGYGA